MVLLGPAIEVVDPEVTDSEEPDDKTNDDVLEVEEAYDTDDFEELDPTPDEVDEDGERRTAG